LQVHRLLETALLKIPAWESYNNGMNPLQVIFLGTGDAFGAGGRHQAAYLVSSGEGSILLDCGATTLASMRREQIAAGCVDAIFLSHFHGDHFAGLPFLLLEYTYHEPRRRALTIGGPPGTRERVAELYRAMYRQPGARPLPFELHFIELLPGRQAQAGRAVVDPFRVPHQQDEMSLGFILAAEGKRILYSGDTGWTEELVVRSQETDLFICECSFFETRMDGHLDYARIAENRHRFGSKRLVLSHLGGEVLARRDQIEIELASDGLRIDIE
jgi:ribonuclease BN (tRNA processing enzyme)